MKFKLILIHAANIYTAGVTTQNSDRQYWNSSGNNFTLTNYPGATISRCKKIIAILLLLMVVINGEGQTSWNFEGGNLQGWSRTGSAFNTQPTLDNNVIIRRPGSIINIQGNYWIGTFENHPRYDVALGTIQGDEPTGVLTSDPFTLTSRYASFLLGGGNDINRLRVQFLIKLNPGEAAPPLIFGIGQRITQPDGDYFVAWYTTGRNTEVMQREIWEVDTRYYNRTARVRIEDNSSAAWGHINVDDFLFSATPPGTEGLTGDLRITGVEVTQAIQTPSNGIPLIAGKPTVVRVFLQGIEDARGPWRNVMARLTVRNISGGLTSERVITSFIDAPASGSHRDRLDDNINFILDYDQTVVGERQLDIQIQSATDRPETDFKNNRQSLRVLFNSNYGFGIYGLRFRYTDAPVMEAAPFSEFELHRSWAQSALPLANLFIYRYPGDPVGTIKHRWVADPMGRLPWQAGYIPTDEGYLDGDTWARGLIDRLYPAGGAWVMDMQPEITTGYLGNYYGSGAGNHIMRMQRNNIDPGPTFAHEIGHGFRQPHTWENPWFPHLDRSMPLVAGNGFMGPQVGIRTGAAPYGFGLQLFPGSPVKDLMNYGTPAWFSPYSYTEILRIMTGGTLSVADPVRNARSSKPPGFQKMFPYAYFDTNQQSGTSGTATEQPYLYISGRVEANGRAIFEPFEIINSANNITTVAQGKGYVLISFDTFGTIVSEQFVDTKMPTEDVRPSTQLFSLYMPWNPKVKRIILCQGTKILAERIVSANAPTLTLNSINTKEPLVGKQIISWIAQDPDKDSLTFSVWYNPAGKTWLPLAIGVKGNSYEVNFDNLPGSEMAQMKVLASDGVNTTEAQLAGTLIVPRKAPLVTVKQLINPAMNKAQIATVTISEDNPLLLSGSAFDWEEGPITEPANLTWQSDRDGQLGVGPWIVLRKLTPGIHIITLAAFDSDKKRGFDSIIIYVQAPATRKNESNPDTATSKATNALKVFPNKLSLFPNPVSTTLNVDWQNEFRGNIKISLIDASGKIVKMMNANKGEYNYRETIAIGTLAKGIYFIKINMQNGQSLAAEFLKN